MFQLEVSNISKAYDIEQQGRPKLTIDTWKWLLGNQTESIDLKNCFWALKDVNFKVRKGERVGIIGPNGAGKSTLLKILSRVVNPTTGQAVIRGRVGSLLELGAGFNENLSGRDNIYLNASLYGLTREEINLKFKEIIDFSGVGKFIDTPTKHYSSGMRVRLAFAIAAHIDPDVLILDEVLAVGDIAFQKKCLNRISGMTSEGRTLLLVSHSLGDIAKFCDRVIWLDAGQIRFDGDVSTGIAMYQTQMLGKNAGQALDVASFRGERRGSGAAKFERIRILGTDMQPRTTIRTGEEIVFELSFSVDEDFGEEVRQVTATVVVENDKKQRLFTAPSEVLSDSLGSVSKSGRVMCHIRNLPLVPGIYHLTASLQINRQLVDKVVDVLTFSVFEGDFYGTGKLPSAPNGYFCVQYQWQMAADEASRTIS